VLIDRARRELMMNNGLESDGMATHREKDRRATVKGSHKTEAEQMSGKELQ
jgi:hypothetical protein